MKAIILAIAISISNIVFAQQFKVSFSAQSQDVIPDAVNFNGEFFSLSLEWKKRSHSITLNKHGKDLQLIKSVQASNGEKLYGPKYPSLKIFDGKLYLFYYQMPEDQTLQLFAANVDPVSLQLSEAVELQTIKGRFRSIFLELSPDGSKILIAWNTGPDNKGFYSVWDKELKKIRSGEDVLEDVEKIALDGSSIDNSGNAFLLYRFPGKRKERYSIWTVNSSGKKTSNEITLPEGEISSVFTGVNPKDNKLFIVGTYKQDSKLLTGVFNQAFDPTYLKFDKINKTPFTKELVEILDEERWANKKSKNYGLSDGLVLQPFVLADGTLSLVGEFRGTIVGQKTSFDLSGSILIARFNNESAVFSRIPKIRVSAGRTYGDSYKVIEFKNKLIVFYNDHEKNIKLDLTQRPDRSDNYSNSVFVAATVNETGDVKREIIADLSKESYLAEYESMISFSSLSYFVPFRKIKKLGGLTDDLKWATINIE